MTSTEVRVETPVLMEGNGFQIDSEFCVCIIAMARARVLRHIGRKGAYR